MVCTACLPPAACPHCAAWRRAAEAAGLAGAAAAVCPNHDPDPALRVHYHTPPPPRRHDMSIAQDYLRRNDGRAEVAAAAFARDLMRGDPATLRAGYTADNALLAAVEAFGLSDAERADVAERLGA